MSLRVLNVAFPFAQLTPDPVGGAEQVLMQIDRALVDAGHQSIVMAQAGSQVCGRLVPIEPCQAMWDERMWPQTHEYVRRALAELCARESLDVVHLHGVDFDAYLPPAPMPTLVTLHLPIDSYPARALRRHRAGIYFNPVSATQACPALDHALLSPIENGVPLDAAPRSRCRGRFALMLGRMCPEKGFHLAIDAAELAHMPLLLAGAIHPWPEHLRYFEEQIRPRLDAARRWIGRIAGARKRRLLARARCVLIPSRIAETSSLVAMEALAAGTPVIAFRIGALPRIVEHGVTGYIVDDVQEMADAIRMADRLDREACWQSALRRFDVRRTVHEYLDVYRRISAHELGA